MRPDEIIWMPVEIALRRTADGEVRVYQDKGTRGDDGKFEPFIWEEGNFACDCNRYLFFEQAGGHDPTDEEDKLHGYCGDTRYRVEWIKDAETGELLYTEVQP